MSTPNLGFTGSDAGASVTDFQGSQSGLVVAAGNTIVSTKTVTHWLGGTLTSIVVSSIPGIQTSTVSSLSSIPSATATSSSSTTLPVSSNPTTRSSSPQLGPIVGGVVAVFALILIFIFLLLVKLQASRRENRLRAEKDPVVTPFNRDVVDTREELGRNLNVNDYGSEMPRQTVQVPSSKIISPELKRARTNHTAHNLIANGASEEMTRTLPGQSLVNETHLQTDLANNSTESDNAPPTYDSLSSRNSHLNSSSSRPSLEPSRIPG